jgi:cell division inhibitor SepF
MSTKDKPGFFKSIKDLFAQGDEVEVEPNDEPGTDRVGLLAAAQMRPQNRYTVSIRTKIVSFEDAMAAANGLKRCEQQILNLSETDPILRQKIVDFLCGVNFAEEGTMTEVGNNVYVISPANAFVEEAPSSPTSSALKN